MKTKAEPQAVDAAAEFHKRWTPKLVARLEPDRQIALLRFTPCGEYLLGGGYDGTVWRWQHQEPPAENADKKEKQPKRPRRGLPEAPWRQLERFAAHGGWVTALEVHPREPVAFSADSWGRFCAWDYRGPQAPRPRWQQPQAHDGWITAVALSPDGKQLATAGIDGTVALWNAADGKLQRRLTGHAGEVLAVTFHPGGKDLVSGDLFGNVLHWELPAGTQKRRLDATALYKLHRLQDCGGVRLLRFRPDGKQLAVAGTRPNNGATIQGQPTVLLFDWAAGSVQHEMTLGPKNECFVCDLFFHEAGFLAAVTSGTPGSGRLILHRPGEEKPFYTSRGPINCHSLARHPQQPLVVVAATNAGSNGNGRQLRDGKYVGNHSPLFFFAWQFEG